MIDNERRGIRRLDTQQFGIGLLQHFSRHASVAAALRHMSCSPHASDRRSTASPAARCRRAPAAGDKIRNHQPVRSPARIKTSKSTHRIGTEHHRGPGQRVVHEDHPSHGQRTAIPQGDPSAQADRPGRATLRWQPEPSTDVGPDKPLARQARGQAHIIMIVCGDVAPAAGSEPQIARAGDPRLRSERSTRRRGSRYSASTTGYRRWTHRRTTTNSKSLNV